MIFQDLPPLLLYLECAILVISMVSFLFAILLIRAARHMVQESRSRPPFTVNTPLTRIHHKRSRDITRV